MSTENNYKHGSGKAVNPDGMELFYQYWQSPEHRANLIITHGIGEHSGRYRHVVNFMQGKGVTIIAGDHQGHGLSAGKRGHVKQFHHFARDLEVIRQTTLSIQDNKPTFLLGHSLGGLIAIDHLINGPQDYYAGVIFSSPAFGINVPVPAWKYLLARILNFIMPSFTMANGINPDDLSRDRNEVEIYKKDELVHDRISVSMFLTMLKVIDEVHKRAGEVTLPVLLMLGGNDKVISTDEALKLYSLLGTVDKKQYICPISNHELFNEIDRTHNLEEMWLWINEKLAIRELS